LLLKFLPNVCINNWTQLWCHPTMLLPFSSLLISAHSTT
jgi:hypothetical protein